MPKFFLRQLLEAPNAPAAISALSAGLSTRKNKKLIYEALNEQTILQENTGLITVAGEYFHAELDAE